MKILLYVNSHLPDIGGRELVVHNLALQYQAKGHEVVVAGAAGFRTHRNTNVGYPVRRWPVWHSAPDLSRATAYALHMALNNYDVVHAHSTYPCGFIATKQASLWKPPIVITPHGEDNNVVPEIGFGQRLNPEQAPKIEYAVRNASLLTAISDTVYDSSLDAGAPADRVVKIPNGVNIERFSGANDVDAREVLGLPSTAKLITSIGNYHPRKGHDVLVEAIALAREKNPDLHLVIVGRTDEGFRSDVAQRHAPDLLTFTGALSVPLPGSGEGMGATMKKCSGYSSTLGRWPV